MVIGVELRWQLNELKLKELASLENPVSDTDLFSIFFASLPHPYNNILSFWPLIESTTKQFRLTPFLTWSLMSTIILYCRILANPK